MAKKNYQPISSTLTSANMTRTAVPYKGKNLTTSMWNVILLYGIAETESNSVIASGTVVIWLDTAQALSIDQADYMTVTDSVGRYGVTVEANKRVVIKIYS